MTTRKTLKGKTATEIKPSDAWNDEPPKDPAKIEAPESTKEKLISKSFSIPPSFLNELEIEAAKLKIETGKRISVSALLVKYCRDGMKK